MNDQSIVLFIWVPIKRQEVFKSINQTPILSISYLNYPIRMETYPSIKKKIVK